MDDDDEEEEGRHDLREGERERELNNCMMFKPRNARNSKCLIDDERCSYAGI